MRIYTMLPIALIAAIVLGQEQTLPPTTWGVEVEGLQLSVVAQRDAYRVGEAVRVKTYIRNTGQSTYLFKKKSRRIAEYRLLRADKTKRVKKSSLSENFQVLRMPDGKPMLSNDGKEIKIDLSLGRSASPILGGETLLLEEIDVQADFELTEPGLYILETLWDVPSRDNPEKRVPIVANQISIRIVRI